MPGMRVKIGMHALGLIMRVAVRAVLSREDVRYCVVRLRDAEAEGAAADLLPGFSSVSMLLGLDFALLETEAHGEGEGEGEGEGAEGEGEGEGVEDEKESAEPAPAVRFVVTRRESVSPRQ